MFNKKPFKLNHMTLITITLIFLLFCSLFDTNPKSFELNILIFYFF